LDVRELKEILQILEEQSITEFELEQEGVKLRICRQPSSNHVGSAVPAPSAPVITLPAAVPSSAVLAAAPAPAAPTEVESSDKEAVVKSPIVGTFYRSADPNSPPFVGVGDRVKVGQVLCIIEAMKLMNEIESEHDGQLVKILAENGQAVQYGDKLFALRGA